MLQKTDTHGRIQQQKQLIPYPKPKTYPPKEGEKLSVKAIFKKEYGLDIDAIDNTQHAVCDLDEWYDSVKRNATHEDELIHKRLTWLFAFNTFLIAAAILLITEAINGIDGIAHSRWAFGALIGFHFLLCSVGLAFCVISFFSIKYAEESIKRLHLDWVLRFVSTKDLDKKYTEQELKHELIKRMGVRPRLYGIGYYPDPLYKGRSRLQWVAAPTLLLGLWFVLLLFGLFVIVNAPTHKTEGQKPQTISTEVHETIDPEKEPTCPSKMKTT
ncbi:MAG: hypothetical protein AAF333_01625 [Planctomycetota bacterium]